MTEECKRIKQPVLFSMGSTMLAGTSVFSLFFNGISKVTTISDAAHMMDMEKPEKYAELLWEFLKD